MLLQSGLVQFLVMQTLTIEFMCQKLIRSGIPGLCINTINYTAESINTILQQSFEAMPEFRSLDLVCVVGTDGVNVIGKDQPTLDK